MYGTFSQFAKNCSVLSYDTVKSCSQNLFVMFRTSMYMYSRAH